MQPLKDQDPAGIRALGRRALDLAARRIQEISRAVRPDDLPLQDLLRKLMIEVQTQADEVAPPGEADDIQLQEHLKSLTRSLGDGVLHRDIALFLAESLEEELSRFFIALAEHAGEWRLSRLFQELAGREQRTLRHLRDVVLQD